MIVSLNLNSEPRISARFESRNGISLKIITAPLMDRSQVFVVPDEPRGLDESLDSIFTTNHHQETIISVTTDPQNHNATTLTGRVNITDIQTREILSGGAKVSCHQASPNVMEVMIGQARRSLSYPLPVTGSRSKLQIARKSSYVEVCHYIHLSLTLPYKARCRSSSQSQGRLIQVASPSIDSPFYSPIRLEHPGIYTICSWTASLSWMFLINPAWDGSAPI